MYLGQLPIPARSGGPVSVPSVAANATRETCLLTFTPLKPRMRRYSQADRSHQPKDICVIRYCYRVAISDGKGRRGEAWATVAVD